MTNILFVCLGNICRSPAAEGILKSIIKKSGKENDFFIDSAGILSVHKGELPDSRMINCASKRGYDLNSISRPIEKKDFDFFDYIIGMDDSNIKALRKIANSPEKENKIYLMSDFLSIYSNKEIPDPYYGNASDFEFTLDLLEDACSVFYKKLINNKLK